MGGGEKKSDKQEVETDNEAAYGDDQDDDEEQSSKLQLGPQCTLKAQIEKDKFPSSLCGLFSFTTETLDPEVKITSVSILAPDNPDIVLEVPDNGKPKGLWFTLKEGSRHSLKFSFRVSNNIVSGLKCTNTVWKTGSRLTARKR